MKTTLPVPASQVPGVSAGLLSLWSVIMESQFCGPASSVWSFGGHICNFCLSVSRLVNHTLSYIINNLSFINQMVQDCLGAHALRPSHHLHQWIKNMSGGTVKLIQTTVT